MCCENLVSYFAALKEKMTDDPEKCVCGKKTIRTIELGIFSVYSLILSLKVIAN